MKKLFLLLFFFTASCIYAKAPAWYEDIENTYPDSKYIAQIGYGKTRQAAEMDAAARISRFFQTKISTNAETSQAVIIKNGSVNSRETINTHTMVESQMELFAVEYSKPYFDKSLKQTAVVAYIDRNKAWRIYESKIQTYADIFLQQYKSAELKQDSLKKYFLFLASKTFSSDFLLAYEFGMLLAPSKCKVLYGDINDKIVSLNSKINDLKMECTMIITVKGDNSNTIYRKLSSLLSKEGFAIQKQKAPYQVRAEYISNITYVKDEYGETFTSYPGIEIVIENNGVAIFSYSKTCQKTVAFTKQKNIVMSSQKVEQELDSSFLEEFSTFISSK